VGRQHTICTAMMQPSFCAGGERLAANPLGFAGETTPYGRGAQLNVAVKNAAPSLFTLEPPHNTMARVCCLQRQKGEAAFAECFLTAEHIGAAYAARGHAFPHVASAVSRCRNRHGGSPRFAGGFRHKEVHPKIPTGLDNDKRIVVKKEAPRVRPVDTGSP